LVVGGNVQDTGSDYDFGLVKLTAAGGLDIGWGSLGRRVIPIDAGVGENADSLQQLAVLPDGSLLVAGWNTSDSQAAFPKAAVAKLTPGGDLDTSFGNDGIAVVEVPFAAGFFVFEQVLFQPDGKILYLGWCQSCPDSLPQGRPLILRLTTAGTLDPSFSGDGLVLAQSPPLSESYALAFALDSAGRILVLSSGEELLVSRFTSSGQLDTAFGGGLGYVPVARPTGANNPFQLAIDAASGALFVSYKIHSGPNWGFTGVMRLDRNGALDPTYGENGEALLTLEDQFVVLDTHLQTDGKLLLAGITTHSSPVEDDPILFRLRPNGTLDPGFDGNGVVIVDFDQGSGNDEDARAFTLAGGRPVAVGSVQVNDIPRFGIARLQSALIFTDGFEVGTQAGWSGN
jgi:uncharacterized delta-60 repeat protein